jgi:hypothetical protein
VRHGLRVGLTWMELVPFPTLMRTESHGFPRPWLLLCRYSKEAGVSNTPTVRDVLGTVQKRR